MAGCENSAMPEVHCAAVDVHLCHPDQAAVAPIDQRLESRKCDKPDFEIEVKGICKSKGPVDTLASGAVQGFQTVQRQRRIVLVWRADFRPAWVLEARPLEILVEEVSRSAGGLHNHTEAC